MNLLIATKNPGKFGEISKFLKMPGIKLCSLNDFPKIKEPIESGETFKENALKKAKYYANKFSMSAVADDGGLEIEIFNGEPGVKSRRWLDGVHEATDEELVQYCLEKMKGVKNRKAKLTACLCLYVINELFNVGNARERSHGNGHDHSLQSKCFYYQESIAGVISTIPSSSRFPGFPFRSLLWIPQLKKFYNEDEFTESETKKYNHRYRAIAKIKNQLFKYL